MYQTQRLHFPTKTIVVEKRKGLAPLRGHASTESILVDEELAVFKIATRGLPVLYTESYSLAVS